MLTGTNHCQCGLAGDTADEGNDRVERDKMVADVRSLPDDGIFL